MRNEKQETIADIVREIRHAEAIWHRSDIAQLPTQYLDEWANRIEAAAKREREAGAEAAQVCVEIGEMIVREETREKSSRVGNSAKMREALVRAQRVLHCAIVAEILKGDDAQEALNVVTAALSTPQRNCDVLSKDEALDRLYDRSFSKEDTIEWLYAEAKGETK